MSEFTPGPWKAEQYETSIGLEWRVINSAGGVHIPKVLGHATTAPFSGLTKATNSDKANAHLIAAAPEMYEALVEVTYFLNELRRNHRIYGWTREAQIDSALAKARGEVSE